MVSFFFYQSAINNNCNNTSTDVCYSDVTSSDCEDYQTKVLYVLSIIKLW